MIQVNENKLGQYLENIIYFESMNNREQVRHWAKLAKDYLEHMETLRNFKKEKKNG